MNENRGRRGHKVPPLSTEKIRKEANRLRRLIQVVEGVLPSNINVINILENTLPQIYPDLDYEILPDNELEGDYARTYPDKWKMEISSSTYDAARRGEARAKFTIAHEIGHLVLHRNIKAGGAYARSITNHKVFEDSEWQADNFSAEFLMPYEEMHRVNSPHEIQFKYGVSNEAAKYRYNKVKK